MAMEPFIYTNPAAGQQAVQYAQLQAQQDMDRNRLENDLYKAMSQQATQLGVGSQQAAISRNQMNQRAAEAEKDRALQREGYTNAQTVAGITAGPRADALRARDLADAAANKQFALENFNRGTSFAQTLNDPKTPGGLKQKLMQSGDVEMGPDGMWRSRHANPNLITESIDDIRQRVLGIPGSMGVGGRIPAAMSSMPSRSRMLQMSPSPSIPSPVDYPSAPPGPSPFEPDGFKVYRQSDFAPVDPVPDEVDRPWMYDPSSY